MKIVRGRLSAADVENPSIRYNSDCDCVQQTNDGGVTWVDNPSIDPRHSVAFLKPPITGSAIQCDSAANMVKWLKDFIDQCEGIFTLVGGVTTIINALLLELEIIAPYVEFLALISEIAETISTIGEVALTAAFTSTEYGLLQCIFFCNLQANGNCTRAGLTVIETQITAQLNSTAALVTNAILSLQGEVGLTNAGRVASETGDCTPCACGWCQFFEGDPFNAVWEIVPGESGSWDGTKFLGAEFNSASNTECVIDTSFAATPISYVAFEYQHTAGSGGNNVVFALGFLAGDVAWIGTEVTDTGDHLHYSYAVANVMTDRVEIVVNAGTSGGATAIYNAQLEGLDTSPFGDNNC